MGNSGSLGLMAESDQKGHPGGFGLCSAEREENKGGLCSGTRDGEGNLLDGNSNIKEIDHPERLDNELGNMYFGKQSSSKSLTDRATAEIAGKEGRPSRMGLERTHVNGSATLRQPGGRENVHERPRQTGFNKQV